MNIPKRYGQGIIERCPFCSRHSTTTNEQGVSVCSSHKAQMLPDLKCLCGEYLDLRKGKYGVYFNCIRCGNMNMRRALEINDNRQSPGTQDAQAQNSEKKQKQADAPTEITVRSDDPRYFE